MISKEEVEKLAELSRIALTEEEKVKLQGELEGILGYIDQIKNATTDGAMMGDLSEHRNVFREDGEPHEPGKYTEKLMAEVPRQNNGYVKVKKILEGGR